jgi:hypothetical protein
LAGVAALAVAGCGPGKQRGTSPSALALARFIQAYRAGDYATACEYVVPHPGVVRHMESTWYPAGDGPTPPATLHRLEAASGAGCRPLLDTYAALHWLPLTFGLSSVLGVTINGDTARVCIGESGATRRSDFPTHGSLVLAAYPVVWLVKLEHGRWLVRTLNDVGLCPLPPAG